MPLGHDAPTQTLHAAHLPKATQCIPGATSTPSARQFQNVLWQTGRKEQLGALLSDVVSRCVTDIHEKTRRCVPGEFTFGA